MNVKQALKERNRLAKEIKELYGIAQMSNSIEKGNPRKFNVADSLSAAKKLTEELIDLKVRTHIANMPAYEKIFRLSELKSVVNQIKSIDTTEGKQVDRYSSNATPSFKEVEMDVIRKNILVKEIEKEINALQDQLDYHNSTTEI